MTKNCPSPERSVQGAGSQIRLSQLSVTRALRLISNHVTLASDTMYDIEKAHTFTQVLMRFISNLDNDDHRDQDGTLVVVITMNNDG